jgi:RNA polymerase sigma-70 factor (family 1)
MRGDQGNRFNETAVLQQLSEGSEPAFRVLYERYHATIYRTALRFLQSPTLAEDTVQEVFSSIWQRREEMAHVKVLDAYIKTMARNQVYTFLRAISFEHKHQGRYLLLSESSIDNCDFGVLDDQNERLLKSILNSLPARQLEVYELSRNEGLSLEGIAERLNISPGTAKNHLVRALQNIRQQLSPHLDGRFFWILLPELANILKKI